MGRISISSTTILFNSTHSLVSFKSSDKQDLRNQFLFLGRLNNRNQSCLLRLGNRDRSMSVYFLINSFGI
jgi:hypothetical protein